MSCSPVLLPKVGDFPYLISTTILLTLTHHRVDGYTSLTFTEPGSFHSFRMPHGTLSRPSTSYTSRPFTADSRRPSTAKSRTGLSSVNQQDIICAVIESRGVSPIVGIAFLNITSTEVILCQINDSQSYVRTIQKLQVYGPSVVLVPTYSNNASFKLHSSIEEHLDGRRITEIDRKYFAEKEGTQLLQQFAFLEDLDALNVSIKGYFYAMCCFTAVMMLAAATHLQFELTKPGDELCP